MEICKEEDAFIRQPRRRLPLFSQRAQLHNTISQWLESTVAAMKNVQAALPPHPTERHQVLPGTVLNTAFFLFCLSPPVHNL